MEISIPPASPTPLSGGCTDPKSQNPQEAGDPANAGGHDGYLALVGAQRALLDSLPDVTWIKNTEGALTAVNAAFGERYGMTPEAAVGWSN